MAGPIHLYVYAEVTNAMATEIRNALTRARGRPVTLHVNSHGGSPFAAMAIASMLRAHGGVRAIVDGLAASAASVVLMGAKIISMPSNSMLMIHRAAGEVAGNAGDLREAAGGLDTVDQQMAVIYAARTGLPAERILSMLEGAGTWLTADEAKALGFADEVLPAMAAAARVAPTVRARIDAIRARNDAGKIKSVKLAKVVPAPPADPVHVVPRF